MAQYSKYNLVYRLQKWIDTVAGQTFLNYAYSWGASIVILGALFKLTHIPGANIWLFLGMGTEVFVFFISAFDRPFDKTADGRDLPTRLTEEYLASGVVTYGNEHETQSTDVANPESISFGGAADKATAASGASQGHAGGGTIIIGNVSGGGDGQVSGGQVSGGQVAGGQVAGGTAANYVPQMSAEDAEALNEAQGSYVEELKKLVETLEKVNEQSSRLARDSEEMDNLNRTLTGISRVYEMQLKGASQQIGTIDQINEQSRKLAQQIEQLNKIYARMIEAMTVNMPMGNTPAAPQS